jgi:beta-glucosidase/6-phospho-beta-glucosidase/beta-galactosidase
MLFHSFNNQDERRAFGGSDFLELQFCQHKRGTSIKNIVSEDEIVNWCNDSLYVCGDDWETFYKNYKNIFKNGVYSNLKNGEVDWCSINYYSPEQVEEMIKIIEEKKPKEYQVVLEWLNKAKEFNGVYILGV